MTPTTNSPNPSRRHPLLPLVSLSPPLSSASASVARSPRRLRIRLPLAPPPPSRRHPRTPPPTLAAPRLLSSSHSHRSGCPLRCTGIISASQCRFLRLVSRASRISISAAPLPHLHSPHPSRLAATPLAVSLGHPQTLPVAACFPSNAVAASLSPNAFLRCCPLSRRLDRDGIASLLRADPSAGGGRRALHAMVGVGPRRCEGADDVGRRSRWPRMRRGAVRQ